MIKTFYRVTVLTGTLAGAVYDCYYTDESDMLEHVEELLSNFRSKFQIDKCYEYLPEND